MRDAFGGAFMIKLFLVFIIIYVGFTAIALNYAKAFKAKNIVITYLEENKISNLEMTAYAETAMKDYFTKEVVGNLNYVYPTTCKSTSTNVKCYEDIGIMIEQIVPPDNEKNKLGIYYRVTTYFGFQLPFLDRLLALEDSNRRENVTGRWEVIGETAPIAIETDASKTVGG